MRKVRFGDFYRTNNQILRITEETAGDPFEYFPTLVKGDTYEKVCADILRRCYESDPVYTRHKLQNPFHELVSVDASKDDDGTVYVEFRLKYGYGEVIDGFSLAPHDDVSADSLYRLFAGSLEKTVMEPNPWEKIEEMRVFDEIALLPSFNIESITQVSFIQRADDYVGFYIPPALLLTERETAEEPPEAEKKMYQFQNYALGSGHAFGYELYSLEGELQAASGIFFGDDTSLNGMAEALPVGQSVYIGNFHDIGECLSALEKGVPIDDQLYHFDKENASYEDKQDDLKKEKSI